MIKQTIRTKEGGTRVANTTARKSIQLFCVECMGFSAEDVKRCIAPLCPLYPFRLYKTPIDTVLSEEEIAPFMA